MSEQSITIVVAAIVTIVTLWIKSHYDRKALEDKTDKTAAVLAGKTAGDVKGAVDEIDKIRVMVDGQRTAMMAELKAAITEIASLKQIVASQRETAAATAGKGRAT